MKEEKRRVVVTVLTVILLIIIFSGVTYAYFTATNNQGATSLITVTGGKMIITYKDGNSSLLVSKEITPSNEIRVDKTFTLTGTNTTSGLAMPYKVGIKYTNGFSNGQLYYYIKRTNTNSNITSNLIGEANQTIPGHPSETGEYQKKIKIVRNESLGRYSWDTTQENVNGKNNWTTSKIKEELNGDYLDTTLTANKPDWYNSSWSSSGPVFSQTGIFNFTKVIKNNYQSMISNTAWNIGAGDWTGNSPYNLNNKDQYNAERGSTTYQNSRPTTWMGKVGLIYASDYGYASTDTECRNDLRAGVKLNGSTMVYNDSKCKNNNWLYKGTTYWTISTSRISNGSVFYVYSSGPVHRATAYVGNPEVYPSLYLIPNVKRTKGLGTSENPYKLSI